VKEIEQEKKEVEVAIGEERDEEGRMLKCPFFGKSGSTA
jgi:hypothetical protein